MTAPTIRVIDFIPASLRSQGFYKQSSMVLFPALGMFGLPAAAVAVRNARLIYTGARVPDVNR